MSASDAPMHKTQTTSSALKVCDLLSIKGVSHAGVCLMCLYKLYWTTNPEVLFDVLGTKQRKSDQSSLSSCFQVHWCGWLQGLRGTDFLV